MNKDFFLDQKFLDGEMLPYERFKLYTWISEIKPKVVFEVGTGTGGGSTFFIASAILNMKLNSTIYTCDPSRSPTKEFLDEFESVKFYRNFSNIVIPDLINNEISPDFIMFDGPEDPMIAYNDLIYLEKYISNDTYFCMHDWDEYRNYDNSRSTKSVKVREYIENSLNWTLVEKLDANIKNSNFDNWEYDSVGLCLYKFKKNNNYE
jgi:hypothetical protein